MTVVYFGPFRFDAHTRLLYRRGQVVRLRTESAAVLALLIQSPDQLVHRAAIRSALWPPGTDLRFASELRGAVDHIRRALGTPADRPAYVQAVGSQGYMFAGPVSAKPPDEGLGPFAMSTVTAVSPSLGPALKMQADALLAEFRSRLTSGRTSPILHLDDQPRSSALGGPVARIDRRSDLRLCVRVAGSGPLLQATVSLVMAGNSARLWTASGTVPGLDSGATTRLAAHLADNLQTYLRSAGLVHGCASAPVHESEDARLVYTTSPWRADSPG